MRWAILVIGIGGYTCWEVQIFIQNGEFGNIGFPIARSSLRKNTAGLYNSIRRVQVQADRQQTNEKDDLDHVWRRSAHLTIDILSPSCKSPVVLRK